MPILYTPIQKINDIYCIIPCFILNNNLVIINMHINIIIISLLFLLFLNINELFLNVSDFILQRVIVYIVGVLKWPQYVLPKSVTSHEKEGYIFWGFGVAPNLTQFTRPSRFLGKNKRGSALMSIRNHVSLNELTKPDGIFTHLCPPYN